MGTCTDAARQVNQALGIQVSRQTVMHTLVRAGLHSQKVKKPHLYAKNMKARLEFTRIHQHWTMEDQSRVVFSDESKINCFCSDGMTWCWTRNVGELSSKTVNQTIKHGGGGIMVWGCMCINGPGLICKVDRCINQSHYLDILEEDIPKIILKFNLDSSSIIFQQDNAPIHRAKLLQKWFSK